MLLTKLVRSSGALRLYDITAGSSPQPPSHKRVKLMFRNDHLRRIISSIYVIRVIWGEKRKMIFKSRFICILCKNLLACCEMMYEDVAYLNKVLHYLIVVKPELDVFAFLSF